MFGRIHDLRIGTRLALGYGLVLALLVAMAILAGVQAARLAANTDYYSGNIVPSIDAMRRIVVAVEDVRRFELEHLAADDIAASTEAEEGVAAARKRLEAGLASYERFASDEAERKAMEGVKAAIAAYLVNWDKLRVLSEGAEEDAKKGKEASRLYRQSARDFQAVHKVATQWGEQKEAVSLRYKASSEEAFRSAMRWLAGCAILAVLAAVASAVVTTRSITRPIGEALALARTVAKGDLSSRVEPRGRDEAADLLRALNEMNTQLVEVVSRVRGGSESVAVGAHQIAAGNNELSNRTEKQAASLQETAASMEELGATVRENAQMAQDANGLAREAAQAARRGGESMREVVTAIDEISARSRRIAEIISVVDGIAFQTNILALNAAVEAARAGEQGRGFAVVAGEVRALAQRSAAAARDVKDLIVGSVAQVDKGTLMVARTGEAVTEIVEQVQRVSDLLDQISRASREQTSSIGQVGHALAQLDDVTQQNAALVEESAAAADSLRMQAQRLVGAVSVFKFDEAAPAPQDSQPAQAFPVAQPAEESPLAVPERRWQPALIVGGRGAD